MTNLVRRECARCLQVLDCPRHVADGLQKQRRVEVWQRACGGERDHNLGGDLDHTGWVKFETPEEEQAACEHHHGFMNCTMSQGVCI